MGPSGVGSYSSTSGFDCSEGHQIHRIVVLENDPDREAYIRRQLTATYDGGSEGVEGGARVVEEGTGVGVKEVQTRRTQSRGNFDDDEAEEGEEDSSSGKEDLGGGIEEDDMGDSGDSSESGSSGDSRDDNIVEGAIVHGGGDQVVASLEGDMADTGTSPNRGRQSLQRTTPMNVGRCSIIHGAPLTRMEKRRKLVHTTDLSNAGGPSMLAGPASPSSPRTSLADAPTMAIVMPIAVRGSPLRPHSLVDAFMAVHHQGAITGGTLVVPPRFRPATTNALAVVQAPSTELPLVVDIISPSVVASIATPVASTPDARVSVPVGGTLIEGISPPSFSLQLKIGVGSLSPTR